MSSSIIQSHSMNKETLSVQYNVPVTIPKGRYQMKSEAKNPTSAMKAMIMNMKHEEPAEIEQLINMMRNHKVSDETSSFHFNFGSDTKDFKPLTPKTSPQPSKSTTFTLSPEFQFSFSANVRSDNKQQKNYIEVGDEYYVDDLDFIEDPARKQETEMNTYYNQHLVNRKILPLPKPRWKRILEQKGADCSNTIVSTPPSNPTEKPLLLPTTTSTDSSRDNNTVTKKLKCSNPPPPPIEHPTVDNKRKERNWNDNCFTTAEITEVTNKDFFVESRLRMSFTKEDIKNWENFVASSKTAVPPAPTTPKIQPKKKEVNKKPTTSTSTSTTTSTKKPTTKKKSSKKKSAQKEDMAPGGFLSSDITLFDNPISDDWICLFCQYDILMYGLEDTKRKNGYYKRKREKAKRLKEAELRRLGGQSDSEEDHEHHHHHHHL